MTGQLNLSSFSDKTVSAEEYTKDFRPWNDTILSGDVEYQRYARGDEGEPQGFIDFHVVVEIVEAVIEVREEKRYNKVKRPGYKLIVTQNMAFGGKEWEGYVVYEESFQEKDLKKAYDVFQREILNVQSWIEISESRAKLIPLGQDAFECPFCGWVTYKFEDDITCCGCGKRFWSEKIWNKGRPQE